MLGDTVWCVIDDRESEPYVTEETVTGVVMMDGEWYVGYGDCELYRVGDSLCKLTREEAERELRELMELKGATTE